MPHVVSLNLCLKKPEMMKKWRPLDKLKAETMWFNLMTQIFRVYLQIKFQNIMRKLVLNLCKFLFLILNSQSKNFR